MTLALEELLEDKYEGEIQKLRDEVKDLNAALLRTQEELRAATNRFQMLPDANGTRKIEGGVDLLYRKNFKYVGPMLEPLPQHLSLFGATSGSPIPVGIQVAVDVAQTEQCELQVKAN